MEATNWKAYSTRLSFRSGFKIWKKNEILKKSRKTQKAPTNLLNTRIDEEEELHNNTGRASVLAVAKFKKRMKQRKKGKEAQVVVLW